MNAQFHIAKQVLWVIAVYLCMVVRSFAASGAEPPDHATEIHWLSWEEKAFQRANAEDKLILLDLTAIWCHACHVMDEMTYANPTIAHVLNTQFIPIRVDADQRPDISARYLRGGWPTTSVLLPSGEILFQANVLGPEELREVLRSSSDMYKENKEEFLDQVERIWDQIKDAKKTRMPSMPSIDSGVIDHAVLMTKQQFDQIHGGFRDAPKFFEPHSLSLALRFGRHKSDSSLQHIAVHTLNKQQSLFDPVWGGFYRYAVNADWTNPHYEKMLDIQAVNLLNYVEAYQVTGHPEYKTIAEGIIAYVSRFLSDRARGGFYASQDADVTNANDPNRFVSGESYYRLGKRERLSIGLPRVDESVFTGWNGIMAVSYLKTYQVFGTTPVRDFALQTLNRLYQERYKAGLGLAHVSWKGTPQDYGFLADNVFFAQALVEASTTTGDRAYLRKAEQLALDVVAQLEDRQAGGFFDRVSSSADLGLLKFPQKPLQENAEAVLLFCDLYYLTENEKYRQVAERTIRFILGNTGPLPVALTALAVDRYLHYPVHIVIVGDYASPIRKALYREALRLYAPGKVVRSLDPRTDSLVVGDVSFPQLPESRAYICTDQLCSPPIAHPQELGDNLKAVVYTASGQQEPSTITHVSP